MSRVYLLLRNNKQSGPHNLEELLRLGLKPLDLIWVEGRSMGWSYPTEINALKSYVVDDSPIPSVEENIIQPSSTSSSPTNNQSYMPPEKPAPVYSEQVPAPSRKIYVSMPAKVSAPATTSKPVETNSLPADAPDTDASKKLEQKAEELRKRAQSYTPENKSTQKKEETIVTKYSSTLENRAGEYSSWIYNQKTKKTKQEGKKAVVISIAALFTLALGFGITRFTSSKKEVVVSTPTATSEISKTEISPATNETETLSMQPAEEKNAGNRETKTTTKAVSDNTKIIPLSEPVKKPLKKVPAFVIPAKETHKSNSAKDVLKNTPVTKNQGKETVAKAPPVTPPTKPEAKAIGKNDAENKPVTTPQKKKTLNEKVDAFFSKFSRKKEDQAPAEVPPASTNSSTGAKERKAVHRDDKATQPAAIVTAPPSENINLADFVEVSTNKPSEDWMLGVHGLKVTVRNASKETVKTAEVELRYYTEQNEILDKKIVNFNNIPPGKTITLPAPDHRLADHADFRLIAVK
ncbi:MAG: FxLYD domain-containing protein [Chitinophagaceae bacterium]